MGNFAGSYTLANDGTLQAQTEYVGRNSRGFFTQTGGSNTTVDLYLGSDPDSGTGSYSLSGGTLQTENAYIGSGGQGMLHQSGGSHTVTDLYVGYETNGIVSLSAGTLSASRIYVGRNADGTFTHTGGVVDLGDGRLAVGSHTGLSTYDLSGTGVLTADTEEIGYQGAGAVVQSGGSNTVEHLHVAGTAAVGYELSGGTLQGTSVHVGADGQGFFSQTGGTHTADSLVLADNGTYRLSGNGQLTARVETIGETGSGTFEQTGGSHTVTHELRVQDAYTLSGGTLTAPAMANTGGFSQSGGTVTAGSTLHNRGSYSYSGGTFDGHLHLYDEGTFAYSTDSFTAGDGITNDTFLAIAAGKRINADGSGLVNNNQLRIEGGTLGGDGLLVNNGYLDGTGTIAGSGGFENNGFFTQTGSLTLSNSGTFTNNLFVELSRNALYLNGGDFENRGTLDLQESIVNGTARLVNRTGGSLQGDGLINTDVTNQGRLLVTGRTGISNGFSNTGVVEMAAATGNLYGGEISNSGTLHGHGQVSSDIANDTGGQIEALDGVLTLSGEVTSRGRMTAAAGSKLLVSQGLAANPGTISLTGGTFDNNGHLLENSGSITGYGTLRSGGLTNSGDMLLAGGSSTVDGGVANLESGTLEVAHSHATFNDDVINEGLFKTTEASVSFAGTFTNNGTYFSDPSTQTFTDLGVGPDGSLVGKEAGDIFRVSGDFLNASLQNTLWDTDNAWLEFVTGADSDHLMTLAGVDAGADLAGYQDNFAWGLMDITGNSVSLSDGNTTDGGAFYVGSLLGLDIAGSSIENLFGNGYNVYYLAGLEDNGYLGGLTYDLADGGQLIAVAGSAPVPVPGAVWLLSSGILGLGLYRRRKRA
jgi:hypothetical protein